ncbi:uncharacterized protein LOC120209036 [Hibiscus syriacus]|uniref:uncharacterized protein LOC120209036 n=1 Tax=Hibiscus syriacus TaxID=106335 RepID=UPI0019215BEF|nr:uncharacterized protein LOC120209036 [Hibiscus syriacus]
MTILCWNCRGLGNPATVHELRRMISIKDPMLVFVSETKLRKNKSEAIRLATKMYGCFEVERAEGCVGLMMLWNERIDVTLLSYSNLHIDVEVSGIGDKFRFTGFYGRSSWAEKKHNWEMISRLASTSLLPWCVGGDFNEIIHSDEKRGGRKPVRSHMEEFFQCLRGADLWDIRPRVGWFSWASGTRAKTYVCERIDRFVAKNDWRLMFQDCSVETISMAMSDHSAISLKLVGEERMCETRKDYFKFDVCWANEDQCRDIVKRIWEQDDTFTAKVGKIGSSLGDWQRSRRTQAKREERRLRELLSRLQSGPITDVNCELRRKAMVDLKEVMDKDESYWFQRSRVAWLKDGDWNSSFFHARANGRRKKNRIEGLLSEGGLER